MASPLLIIVTGPPCSGKITLGRRLAQELQLPFLYKDGIKEPLDIGGHLFQVDTTDWATVDDRALVIAIRSAMKELAD